MPDNLISRIWKVQANGIQYVESASLNQKKMEMRATIPQLKEAKDALNRTLNQSKSMAELGRPVPIDLEEISHGLQTVKQDLASRNFSHGNAGRLQVSIRKAKDECTNIWKAYVEEQIGGTKSILLSIKDLVSENPDFQEMTRAEKRLLHSEAGSWEGRNAIASYLRHFNSLIEKLHLDDEIIDFLKKLTDRKSVPLSEISDSCLKKLRSEAFAGKLKIIIG